MAQTVTIMFVFFGYTNSASETIDLLFRFSSNQSSIKG
jgi:hypothetical protein